MSTRDVWRRIAVLGALTALSVPAATMAVAPAAGASTLSMRGADVSSLQRAVDLGAKYYTAAGARRRPARHPQDGAASTTCGCGSGTTRPAATTTRRRSSRTPRPSRPRGFKLLVDFHYSDTWADPGKQYKPAAWASHGISTLQTDVYNYTYDVCTSLKSQGTTPDSVQIGNEINVGMLWNDGKVINNNFTNLSLLLKAGYNATKACNSATQVIIHTADADSDANARWFYDGITAKGVDVGHHRPVVLLHLARHAGQPVQRRHRRARRGTASRSSSPRPRTRSPRPTPTAPATRSTARAPATPRPGPVRAQRVHGRTEHGEGRRRHRRLLLGADLVSRSPATAGTPPTSRHR